MAENDKERRACRFCRGVFFFCKNGQTVINGTEDESRLNGGRHATKNWYRTNETRNTRERMKTARVTIDVDDGRYSIHRFIHDNDVGGRSA